jgi:N-acetylmuramoyl-L-alanine amidase
MCKDPQPKLVLPPYYAVEVHFNSADDPSRQGFFVMAHKFSKHGQDLARCVVNSMADVLGKEKNKGVNKVDSHRQWIGTDWMYEAQRQYFLCKTVCPAILVECCFLSNTDEAAWISDRSNRSRLGKKIGLGIAEYLEGVGNDQEHDKDV